MITVNGQPLVDEAGDVVGAMTSESFINTEGNGINSYQNATLSLYFADSDGSLMEREMRNVHYSSNSTLEKVVLEELIKGPVNSRLQAVLPPEEPRCCLSRRMAVSVPLILMQRLMRPLPQSPMCPQRPVFMRWWMHSQMRSVSGKWSSAGSKAPGRIRYRDEIDLNQSF